MATREVLGPVESNFQRDFGGLVERRPREVINARSEHDVVDAITRARRLGVGVIARGQGHTTRGQSLIEGGISIATAELDQLRIEGETVVVGAGARWQSVMRAAWAHGQMPPVLTDYLGLSVGGTLSVGGVGGASFRHGMQTDQVIELRVVTGRGDVRNCSAERDRELFDACLAGLGQVAVIVEARLRLVAAPMRVRVTRLAYDALAPFLNAQARLAEEGRFDELRGSVRPRSSGEHRFVIEATQYLATSAAAQPLDSLDARHAQVACTEYGFFEYANRLEALEHDMRVTGLWHAYHPWFDMFVPGSSAHDVIEFALRELDRRLLTSSHVMIYPLRQGTSHTPLLTVPADPTAFLLDVLPDECRGAALPEWEAYSRAVLERALARGGKMYPIGYPVGTPDVDWRQHYGPAWTALSKARAAHDPDRLLSRPNASDEKRVATTTLGEIAKERLAVLGRTTGLPSQAARLTEFAAVLSAGWWLESAAGPGWASDLTDDGTPFELSLAIANSAPELRLLVEPRPVPGDPAATFASALHVAHALRDRYAADLSTFDEVATLFAPQPGMTARFLLWYAVHMTSSGPLFKAYFNPEVHGLDAARELLRTALDRLDMSSAWTFLEQRCAPSTRIPYLSIDLCERAQARVKVYLAHPGASAEDLERVAVGSSNHQVGQVARWTQALVTTEPGAEERPLLTCHAFRRGTSAPDVTLHVPIRSHVRDDREALTLARGLCIGEGAACLDRVVAALAQRPLNAARGMITYLSLRSAATSTRLTVYLAPQVRQLTPVRRSSCGRVGDLHRAIEVAQRSYAAQPFFRRMERGGTRHEVRLVAHRLAFFIMCFQDMERIVCERCTDPEIAAALREHRSEDLGHERWYLADLLKLDVSQSFGPIFEQEHAAIRDVSYALMSLILQTRHDVTMLAIVLALEAAGHVFFGHFIPMVQRAVPDQVFAFFGRSHQQAEAEHQIESWVSLFERAIGQDEAHEMTTAVQETFEQMTRVAEAMEDALAPVQAASTPRTQPAA